MPTKIHPSREGDACVGQPTPSPSVSSGGPRKCRRSTPARIWMSDPLVWRSNTPVSLLFACTTQAVLSGALPLLSLWCPLLIIKIRAPLSKTLPTFFSVPYRRPLQSYLCGPNLRHLLVFWWDIATHAVFFFKYRFSFCMWCIIMKRPFRGNWSGYNILNTT